MTIAITGSSGLIGRALVRALEGQGQGVLHIVRRQAKSDNELTWDPDRGEIDVKKLEGIDGVVNLAGENVAQRWSDDAKRRIRESRVKGTTLLARALAERTQKPRVLLSGSAVGYYGDRGNEDLDESSAPGSDFLASVCKEWEAATAAASDAGIRVVHLRTGVVLAKNGGALDKMLIPFRFGVGGKLSSGKQWMSWITLRDHVRAMVFALNANMAGAMNLVSPNPVTNEEFSDALARVLHRPALFTVPRVALDLALGEMSETVLDSQKVKPAKLTSAGFTFELPSIEPALRAVLEEK
jgi:hypothetical protein